LSFCLIVGRRRCAASLFPLSSPVETTPRLPERPRRLDSQESWLPWPMPDTRALTPTPQASSFSQWNHRLDQYNRQKAALLLLLFLRLTANPPNEMFPGVALAKFPRVICGDDAGFHGALYPYTGGPAHDWFLSTTLFRLRVWKNGLTPERPYLAQYLSFREIRGSRPPLHRAWSQHGEDLRRTSTSSGRGLTSISPAPPFYTTADPSCNDTL